MIVKEKYIKCDSCDKIIGKSHNLSMKEIAVKEEYLGFGLVERKREKRKVKIHLCDRCFSGLSKIAEKKLEELGK